MKAPKSTILNYSDESITLQDQAMSQGMTFGPHASNVEAARKAYNKLASLLKMSERQNNELYATLKKYVQKCLSVYVEVNKQ